MEDAQGRRDAEAYERTTMVATVVQQHRFLTINEVASSLPGHRQNERTSPATITRWILRGCQSLAGRTIRLHAVRAGGRWLVSPDALTEFFNTLGELPDANTFLPSRSPTVRTKASNVAAVKLQALGA
jgi:hypothetical protein